MSTQSKRLSVVVGIALGIGVWGAAPRAADEPSLDAPTILNLRLMTSSELPRVSERALMNETESIWRDANVQLRWITSNTDTNSGRPLRILVARRPVTAIGPHSWPVGELLRFEDSTAIAMASISAALRIVQESPERPMLDVPAMRQYQLGVVLGRAVAHEIGHYLLQTNEHASYGLMRASIDAREFADLNTGAFRLDRESQAYLATRTRTN
jgi:hypothetical protein